MFQLMLNRIASLLYRTSSFIRFSLSNVKQHKSQQNLMYRNWNKFDFEGFIKLLKPCLKFDGASSIDQELKHGISKV